MVVVVVIVAVGTPTVIGTVNGHIDAGSCSIHREGNPRNSESSDDDMSSPVDEPASQMVSDTCT